jgi:hypothetical protein
MELASTNDFLIRVLEWGSRFSKAGFPFTSPSPCRRHFVDDLKSVALITLSPNFDRKIASLATRAIAETLLDTAILMALVSPGAITTGLSITPSSNKMALSFGTRINSTEGFIAVLSVQLLGGTKEELLRLIVTPR